MNYESEFTASGTRVEQSSSRSDAQKERVQTACTYCRYRKVKCDGGRPSCSFCTHMGRQGECVYAKVSEEENESLRKRKRELRARRAAENRGREADGQQRERSSSAASQSLSSSHHHQQLVIASPYSSKNGVADKRRRTPRRASSSLTSGRSQSSMDRMDVNAVTSSSYNTPLITSNASSMSSALDASQLSGLPAELSNTITPNFFSIFHQRNVSTPPSSSNISLDGSPASNPLQQTSSMGNATGRFLGRQSSLNAATSSSDSDVRQSNPWMYQGMAMADGGSGSSSSRIANNDSPRQTQRVQGDAGSSASHSGAQKQSVPATFPLPLQYLPSHPQSAEQASQHPQQSSHMTSAGAFNAYRQSDEQMTDPHDSSTLDNGRVSSSARAEPDFFAAMQASMSRPSYPSSASQPANVNETFDRGLGTPYDMMRVSAQQQQQQQIHHLSGSFDMSRAWHGGALGGVENCVAPALSSSQSTMHIGPADQAPYDTSVSEDNSGAANIAHCTALHHIDADSMSQVRSFVLSEQFPFQHSPFDSLSTGGHVDRHNTANSTGAASSNLGQADGSKPSYPAFYDNLQ